MPNPTPQYRWNERAGRYYNERGRFIPRAEVKAATETVAKASRANIDAITRSFQAGDISLAEWQAGMMREIKTLHVATAAASRGGWAQMSQADWGYTGNLVKKQYQFLQNFVNEIVSGKQPINGRLLVRANMYGEAGRGTFEQMRRRWQVTANNMTEERRVRTAQESCPGCIDQADKGWQPIGTLDPIGAEECRTHCLCHYEYRRPNANGGYDIADDL